MSNDLYAIVNQEPGWVRDRTGRAARGWTVTFESKASGVQGVIELPDVEHTPETVDRLVRAKVAQIDAVAGL